GAGGGGPDAAGARRRGQIGHLVVGAAALEGEHRLHVLALQKHPVAEPRREIGRDFQGRLYRHVVHARPENPLQIVVFHRVFSYPLNGGQGPPPFQGWAILYTNAPSVGKMPAREARLPTPAEKAKWAVWERRCLAHGCEIGKVGL